MTKKKMYRYLGRNGILTTYVLLDGINHILRYRLTADEGMLLTDGDTFCKATEIDADDLNNWYEIPDPEANLNK